MYKNSEGYRDPTAGAAVSNAMREYKEARRREWQRQYALKHRPKVYVASAYAGDTERNTLRAAKACRFAAAKGMMPVASHLLYPGMGFDDNNPADREMCCMFGLALLAVCDEVWCFSLRGEISAGMKAEIEEAVRLRIPVKYFKIEEVDV